MLGPDLRGQEATELRRKLSPLEFQGILKNRSNIVHKGENIPFHKIKKKVKFVSTWLSPLHEIQETALPKLHSNQVEELTIKEESNNSLIKQFENRQEDKNVEANKETITGPAEIPLERTPPNITPLLPSTNRLEQ